jgi:hypothetical protein
MGKKNIESRVKLIGIFWLANFLLHLAWENWQILFYEGMAEAPHAQAVWTCPRKLWRCKYRLCSLWRRCLAGTLVDLAELHRKAAFGDIPLERDLHHHCT